MPRRLATASFWRYEGWKLAASLLLASLAVAGGVTLRSHDTHALDDRICGRVDNLDRVIVAVLKRQTLPTNPFYLEHPELLPTAHRQNARAIRELKGASC